jgi:NADH/F420H2 dehydrogenase subunit C
MKKNYPLNIFKSLPLISYKKEKLDKVVASCLVKDAFAILSFLRNSSLLQYKILTAISVVDYPERLSRFEVVYELLSLFNTRFRLKIYTTEKISVDSIIILYSCANWWEREAWDLFGIFFRNHSDLRRILTDYGFDGHPLRKDFPCNGFIDLRYDENAKRIIVDNLRLDQIFRLFDYKI